MQNPEVEQLPKTAEPIHVPPAGKPSLGLTGNIVLPGVVMKPACIYPTGKHWSKQQHLVLVPEESSDRVAWRPDVGSWTPRMSEVSTHTKKDK